MILYPAIDLMGGEVVRLDRGRFDQATRYDSDPRAALARFEEAGADWVHIVDLDGARAGRPKQHDIIAGLAKDTPLKIQAAGGVRRREDVARLHGVGAARVVTGSMCVKEPRRVAEWLEEYGADAIAAALDIRLDSDNAPIVSVNGWTQDSGVDLWFALKAFPKGLLKHCLVTDVNRDGAMQGPNLALIQQFVEERPDLDLQASGGVRDIADIKALRDLGAAGAVVGKALYEDRVELPEALRACA